MSKYLKLSGADYQLKTEELAKESVFLMENTPRELTTKKKGKERNCKSEESCPSNDER